MPADVTARTTENDLVARPDGLRAVVVTSVARAPDGPLLIQCERPESLHFQPAQVAELGMRPDDLNYYAIASAPDERTISFVIKPSMPPAGIDAVRPGDTVWMRGPWGKGFEFGNRERLLLCGIGSAVGALRSALVTGLAVGIDPSRITLLLGLRRFADLAIASDVAAWTMRGVRVVFALTAPAEHDLATIAALGARPAVGRITDLDLMADVTSPDCTVLLAASDDAEQTLIARLTALGVPYTSIQRNFRSDWRDQKN